MLCTQDTSDAGDALHPRIFQMPGLLCTPDTLDARNALDSRMLQMLGMLRPPEAQLSPPAGLGSLQSSVPGVPELLRARRCRCCSRSRQERQSSFRRGPGCSQPSPPERRKIRSAGRDLSRGRGASSPQGAVRAGACRCQPDFHLLLWTHGKGCRNADRGGGAGGERRR